MDGAENSGGSADEKLARKHGVEFGSILSKFQNGRRVLTRIIISLRCRNLAELERRMAEVPQGVWTARFKPGEKIQVELELDDREGI